MVQLKYLQRSKYAVLWLALDRPAFGHCCPFESYGDDAFLDEYFEHSDDEIKAFLQKYVSNLITMVGLGLRVYPRTPTKEFINKIKGCGDTLDKKLLTYNDGCVVLDVDRLADYMWYDQLFDNYRSACAVICRVLDHYLHLKHPERFADAFAEYMHQQRAAGEWPKDASYHDRRSKTTHFIIDRMLESEDE